MTLFYTLNFLMILVVVFMHLTKKRSTTIVLYILQSITVSVLLLLSFLREPHFLFFIVLLATIAVKSIAAPTFFYRVIRKDNVEFAKVSYLNLPLTVIAIVLLVAFAHSFVFEPLTSIADEEYRAASAFAIATMLVSLLLVINRRGALSQVVGILSLENGIVGFALAAGLKHSAGIQSGILFDIAVWIIIATVFMRMLYKHFGLLDVASMTRLKH